MSVRFVVIVDAAMATGENSCSKVGKGKIDKMGTPGEGTSVSAFE